MNTHKKRIQRDDLKDASHIEISVVYLKGGRRGYYLIVQPVTVKDGMVGFVVFSGRRKLLFETARYSEKQFRKAVEMSKLYEDELVAAVIAENQAA